MAALADARRATLTATIAELLRTHSPDLTAPFRPAELTARVDRAVAQARGHGVTEPWDLYRFSEQHLRLGDGFDASPWAAPIFSSRTLSATQKLDRIDYHQVRVLSRA